MVVFSVIRINKLRRRIQLVASNLIRSELYRLGDIAQKNKIPRRKGGNIMGVELIPKSQNIKNIKFSWFYWRVILSQTGAGYIIKYCFIDESEYIYQDRNGSPFANDGFKVTEAEAVAMAMCAKGYAIVKRYIGEQGVTLQKIEQFAEFALQSKGFTIN
jgi:hypothetical protein